VQDTFTFVHRPLGVDGSITVRVAAMTGIITYPPPDHDEIVAGLVPWAKAGVIVKDGLDQGSAYAALMVTGGHGVRMQHGFTGDVAGSPDGVSPQAPRWLRLTRAGDTVTGHESPDGVRWTEVGTAHLPALPAVVRVGMFAASPGDLTLRPVGLGADLGELRFTQTTATFDEVATTGATGAWRADSVGVQGRTDWERNHRAPGLVEADGAFTVTGAGDIAPAGVEGGLPVEITLGGLPIGVAVLVVVAVRTTAADRPRDPTARAALLGAVGLVAGAAAAGITVPVGTALLRAGGAPVLVMPTATAVRVVLGVAVLHAAAAVLAVGLAVLLRRARAAVAVGLAAVVLPAVVATVPLLPDAVTDALLVLTPAAGFAARQAVVEHPQVLAHYAPSAGYFPLPWWAGLAVLCGYAALVLAAAVGAGRAGR
jgi:hypothetical protein